MIRNTAYPFREHNAATPSAKGFARIPSRTDTEKMRADSLATYPTVRTALESQTVEDLKELLALIPAHKKLTRKAEIIDAILGEYEGDGLRQLWSRLDGLQQAAVSEVVHSAEYQHDAVRFRAKYGRDPKWGMGKDGLLYTYGRHPSVLRLFILNNEVPADLKKRLLEFVPEPAETTVNTREAPAETDVPIAVRETERFAADDVMSMLRLVDAGKIIVSDKTRLPGSATLRVIASVLSGGDYYSNFNAGEAELEGPDIGPIQAFAWPMILQAGGLADAFGKKLKLTPAGERALKKPAADVLSLLWKKWLPNTVLDELRRIDVIKGQTGRGKRGLIAPKRRREVVAQTLADCPPGRWMDAEEFRRYISASGRKLQVTRDPWSLYIAEAQYGYLGESAGDEILERRYMLCFLFEYAATLGLIDIAYIRPEQAERDYSDLWGTDDLEFLSRYDGLLSIRINALGAYCLGQSPTYGTKEAESNSIPRKRPNVEIVPLDDVPSRMRRDRSGDDDPA